MWRPRRATSRELETGDRLGEYSLESLVGEGGMGLVFRAVDGDGKVVALKVLKRELGEDEVFRQRFNQEARAAAEVHHPNLLPIYAAGEAEGRHYLVVRYAEGGSLDERIRESGALEVDATLRLAEQLASGLDALHDAGLVHRDVKASNVVFDPEGTGMLTDFGLAKGRAYTVLTRPGQVLGTAEYLAPELVRGERATPATDVYALGCMVCECLTGKTPFSDKTLAQIVIAHLDEDPPDPSVVRPEIGPELGPAALTALEKEPAGRPQSAGAYAALLSAASNP
ncbi:MAG TPA: serine/threonine-protein kinase [Gaiellaceae bacterium]|nr:serine/threonine-protein kinase [Gaiellaceae bacterium]